MAKPMNLRGIGALQEMSEMLVVGSQARQRPMELPLDDVMEDPDQPRQSFDVLALAELSDSIAERGVKTPVSVRPHPAFAGKWMINHGARRYRASVMAGKTTIAAFVDADHDNYDQVVENLQRDGLTPREIAFFIQKRIALGDKKADIARRLGKAKEPSFITYHMALIDAPDAIEEAYAAGTTSPKTLYELRALHETEPEKVAALVMGGDITRKKIAELAGKNLVMTKKIEPPAAKASDENLVMTKEIAPAELAENFVMTKKDAPRSTENDQINAARYERVRRMNPRQFAALWEANLAGKGTFDELVDADIVHST